jgi:RluA family pseudouridine synthase
MKKSDNIEIFFENKDFLVVDKPAGLVVHGDGRTEEMTLVDFIQEFCVENKINLEEQKNIGNPHTLDSGRYVERWGIVNRLDRGTAGLILVAKNQDTFNELQRLFQERKIIKKYEALVWGEVDLGDEIEVIVNEKISRHKKDPRIWTCGFTSSEGGRQTGLNAVTVVRKIKYLSEKKWTLLSLEPKTGRTHQLRLHCRFLGHPIVGDDKYGLNGKINIHSTRQIQELLAEDNVAADKKEKLKLVAKSLAFELGNQKYFFESTQKI